MEEKLKVLLVDDEASIVMVVKRRLESEGFEVLTAMDGQEALALAEKEKPALVILDLMLPKIDGYKVCALLKRNTQFCKIPILIFTARAQQTDESLAYECGADTYLRKPFNSKELIEKVKALLARPSQESPPSQKQDS